MTDLRESQCRAGIQRQACIGKALPDRCPLPAFLRYLTAESWLPQRTPSWRSRHSECFAEFCEQLVQLVEVSGEWGFWGSTILQLGALSVSDSSKRSRRIPGAFKTAVVRKTRASKVNRRPGQMLEGMAAKASEPKKEVSASNGSNFEAADCFQYLMAGRSAFVSCSIPGASAWFHFRLGLKGFKMCPGSKTKRSTFMALNLIGRWASTRSLDIKTLCACEETCIFLCDSSHRRTRTVARRAESRVRRAGMTFEPIGLCGYVSWLRRGHDAHAVVLYDG